MGTLFNRLFGRGAAEIEDDVLGCDMVPAPTLLAASMAKLDPANDDDPALRPASTSAFGPFTTSAQAPIRDS
jgi:hypothetical protein